MSLPSINGEFRAGADPELRFSPGGTAVAKLRAVATQRKQENGQWVDGSTAWVNLTFFNHLAEHVAESVAKGDLVVVVGRLEVEDWEDREGNKRLSVNVLVDAIGPSLKFATAKVTRSESTGGGGGQPQQQHSQVWPAQQQTGDPWAASDDEPPF